MLSPRPTSPVYIAAPRPAITPQPSRPAVSGLAAGLTLVAWPAATSVCSANAPMPERGAELGAVGERHLLRGVEGGEAVPRAAAAAGPAGAAHRAPVEDHEVAGRDLGDVGADRLHDAGGLVAEQEREVVVDRALAVVEVGVAHAARLHGDPRLAGAGIGDHDLAHLDRRALRERDDTLDRCCCHAPCLAHGRLRSPSPPARSSLTTRWRAPGGGRSRRRAAPRWSSTSMPSPRAPGCGRSGCGVGWPARCDRAPCAASPGGTSRRPGPRSCSRRRRSRAGLVGGSCGRSRRSWIGGPYGRRDVRCTPTRSTCGAVDVEHVQAAALGRGVAGHRADREPARTLGRDAAEDREPDGRPRRYRRAGRAATARAGPPERQLEQPRRRRLGRPRRTAARRRRASTTPGRRSRRRRSRAAPVEVVGLAHAVAPGLQPRVAVEAGDLELGHRSAHGRGSGGRQAHGEARAADRRVVDRRRCRRAARRSPSPSTARARGRRRRGPGRRRGG